MSWSVNGKSLEEVQANFDANYPDANSDVRAQFETCLHAAESLLDQVPTDGDSTGASVARFNGETRISLSGHVNLNTGEEGGKTMSEAPQEPTSPDAEPTPQEPTTPASPSEPTTPDTDTTPDNS